MPNKLTPEEYLAHLKRMEHQTLDLLAEAEDGGNRKIASKLRKHLMELQQLIASLE